MKFKRLFLSFVLFLCSVSNAYAYSDSLIIGGQNIGIEVNTKGVLVVGFYQINNSYVANNSKLEKGDYITKINGTEVLNINDFTKQINLDDDKKDIDVEYVRNNKTSNTKLDLYNVNNEYKTGLYVKDNVSGIGTLTFIDPETKKFGALGHEILDDNTLNKLKINNGLIYDSYITGINKSSSGSPGEKEARVDSNEIYGNITKNSLNGIFGNYTGDVNYNNTKKIGDAKVGDAKMLTVTDGENVSEYSIKINNINTNDVNKNIAFTITDEKLLNLSGGVVQGMSGSPIIQDDKIVGAITHVIVENPKKGYGVLINNMLLETEN